VNKINILVLGELLLGILLLKISQELKEIKLCEQNGSQTIKQEFSNSNQTSAFSGRF
jgi:hypothetical protein